VFKGSGIQSHRWLLPLASSVVLFGILLFFFPFDTGYSTLRNPLGWALWTTWITVTPDAQDYTYCFFVPLMVAYLIYERKSQILQAPIRSSNAALGWILFGLFLFWIGSRAGKQYIGCAAIQMLLAGIIFWFWGGSVFRPLFFAWALIAFAWPLPFIDSAVAFPLRMIVSHLAYEALNLIGIACVQNGTGLLSAPNPAAGLQLGERFQIDVADPCSGIHSLMPLLMFSAFYSFFFIKRIWQQWTIFLSAIPLTILGNVVRILLLVTGTLTWGTSFALGTNESPSWYHEACGYVVFIVVLGVECLLAYLLQRWCGGQFAEHPGQTSALDRPRTQEDPAPVVPASGNGDVAPWRTGIILFFAMVMLVISLLSPPPDLSSKAGVEMALPDRVQVPNLNGGDFFGSPAPVSEAELTVLPADTEFSRKNYDDFHGHNIFFSIVLSGKQQYTIHPPQICLVAQGWSITHEENVPVHLASGKEMVVRNLTIQRDVIDSKKQRRTLHAYYMYWYVADGISTPSRDERNWVSSWDRILHNRDHRWAYVIAMSLITQSIRPDGLNADQTKSMLADFIREIVPTIQK
jgi:EpsI family protein